MEQQDQEAIDQAVDLVLTLHGMILAFGGIPLLYYGDELGTINDYSYEQDPDKKDDSRWVHRPRIDWERAERLADRRLRKVPGRLTRAQLRAVEPASCNCRR